MPPTEIEINPYAAPVDVELPADKAGKSFPQQQPTNLTRELIRWSLICVFSAAPSFYFGLGVSNHPLEVPAMLMGVTAFVVAYTALAVSRPWRRLMSATRTRRAIYAAYGVRVAASICFPIGVVNDMMCGILSVGLTGHLLNATGSHQLDRLGQIILTTIVQGIVLNCEIIALILLFLGVTVLGDAAHRAFVRRRSQQSLRQMRQDAHELGGY